MRGKLWVAATLLLCFATQAATAQEKKRILGVFYRGCERVCEAFKERISQSGFPAEITIRDIGQDKRQLAAVVSEARAMKADLVLTYGTTVTLGMIGTYDRPASSQYLSDIPVVFTVVADPFGTRIAKSFESSGRANVTGTFNRPPETINVEVIRQYDPTFTKLGLLYNSNERNSVSKKTELEALTKKLGFELVALEIDPETPGVPRLSEVPRRLAELQERGVRWLYLGSSSFLYKAGAAFTKSAVEHGIAVVSPYEELVRKQQALLSIAARYNDIGSLAADVAIKILRDGKVAGDLPIAKVTDFAYVVNMDVAKKLGRIPPFAFLQIAETVNN